MKTIFLILILSTICKATSLGDIKNSIDDLNYTMEMNAIMQEPIQAQPNNQQQLLNELEQVKTELRKVKKELEQERLINTCHILDNFFKNAEGKYPEEKINAERRKYAAKCMGVIRMDYEASK